MEKHSNGRGRAKVKVIARFHNPVFLLIGSVKKENTEWEN